MGGVINKSVVNNALTLYWIVSEKMASRIWEYGIVFAKKDLTWYYKIFQEVDDDWNWNICMIENSGNCNAMMDRQISSV